MPAEASGDLVTLGLAVFCIALGYVIGYCRGWMRGIEETTRIWNARVVGQAQTPAPRTGPPAVRS